MHRFLNMTHNKQQNTILLTKEEAQADRNWLVFDAKGKTLGRLATEIAKILSGKHKTTYTPHADCGDGVIVLNAKEVKVTGSKESRKKYYYYTGHIGGLREVPYSVMKERKPEFIIETAVKRMLPASKLRNAQMRRLRIFADAEHGMTAQKPVTV